MSTPLAVRNEHGLTVKQEKFAQGMAKGLSQSEAYRQAFDAEKMQPHTVHSEASRLADHPAVTARIRVLLEEEEERMLRDRVRLKQWAMRKFVNEAENEKNSAMARIRATEMVAKAVGLFKDEDQVKDKTPEEIRKELMERLRDMFKAQ